MMDKAKETELIASAARGGPGAADAFEQLIAEYEKLVYSICLRMLSNEQDAQDASQMTFIKVWTGVGGFRADSSFSSWVYRVAANVCLDMLRKRKEPSLSLSADNGEDRPLEIPDPAMSPEDEFERRELRRAVSDCISSLPPDYSSIIVMREMGGLSYSEISSSLSIDVGTVKSRLFRARKKLCSLLLKTGNFGGETASKKEKGGELK